jgi:type II secretory pathway component PulM
MIDWFRQLERREQLVLAIGALLAILIIGWRFVWTPLDARAAALTDEIAERSRLLVDLKRAAGLGTLPGGTGAATAATSSPLAIVDQTARPLGLATSFESTRIDGPDAIYVTFRGAPFDLLNQWLTVLESEHNVTVVTVSSITGSGTPGLVDGQILLART